MSVANSADLETAKGVAVVDNPEALRVFHKPESAAVILRRQYSADLKRWIDSLDPSVLPQGRIILKPAAARSIVTELCNSSHTPSCAQRDELIDDVAELAEIFASLMQAPYLRLRLAAINTNACRKFHVDAVTGRLVCTYRGEGTQFGTSQSGLDPSRVFTVSTGDPILLRGTRWPESPTSGLLHRSPPIEGTGKTRFILVLDEIHDLEKEE